MPEQDNTVVMEGVQLMGGQFRNFEGRKDRYNELGERNFAVKLSDEVAEMLHNDGWNVKQLKPREDDEDQIAQAYLPVAVTYKVRPPRVVLITSHRRRNLEEHELGDLDWADIINIDLIVRPYHWEVGEKSGIKAYLQSMYVTIQEDPLEAKYAEMGLEESR